MVIEKDTYSYTAHPTTRNQPTARGENNTGGKGNRRFVLFLHRLGSNTNGMGTLGETERRRTKAAARQRGREGWRLTAP